ncbi:MAG: hypothetical protein WC897_04185 [Candidatus Gracilibacteria bacterium]
MSGSSPEGGEQNTDPVEILAKAEIDLSVPNKKDAGYLRTLLTSVEVASLSVGVASLSYPIVSSVVEQAIASFSARSALGVLAGIAFLKADQKLSGEAISKPFIALRSGLRTVAFWAFIPTLAAVWSDLSKNEMTAFKVETIRDRVEGYRKDAGISPAFFDMQAGFQKDIITSLDADASLTPQALAKMSIYNDGEFVRWNVLEGDASQLRTWELSDRDKDWTIVCYGKNHWYVFGPSISWEVGAEVEDGDAVQGLLQKNFQKNRLGDTLNERLNESGLIDGIPAIQDSLQQVDVDDSSPLNFDQGLDRLSGFIPTEWNESYRESALNYAKQVERTYIDGYAAAALEIKDRQFGKAALQNPNSYASVLSFIDSSK